RFINTLKLIVNFIDKNPSLKTEYDSNLYKELQEIINEIYKKRDFGSIRKSINQMVKLGLVYPGLRGYHPKTKSFIKAGDDAEREFIFSEIFYKNASPQSSVTNDKTHIKSIEFLLKTLMYKKPQILYEEEIVAIISTDITNYKRGYMTQEELNIQVKLNEFNKFRDRKYNQISYLFKFLQYLPGIKLSKDKTKLFYEKDANEYDNVFDSTRDPLMFRIMKEKIYKESEDLYGKRICYFTKKEQKGLVVSHIIPSAESLNKGDVDVAYDPDNALLLEPNVDAYFDKWDLTFSEEGKPLFGKNISSDFIKDNSGFSIDSIIMEKRAKYLTDHNKKFNAKN